MEFPPTWDIRTANLFETTTGPDNSEVTMQLLAQLRGTGRILDNFRVVLGGTQILDVNVDLGQLIPSDTFKSHRLKFQFWPRDLAIRRNMVTSNWIDVADIAGGNDLAVIDPRGNEISPDVFLTQLAALGDDEPKAASYRWGVMVGSDGLPKLQLQGLPATAVWLSGRHQFKG